MSLDSSVAIGAPGNMDGYFYFLRDFPTLVGIFYFFIILRIILSNIVLRINNNEPKYTIIDTVIWRMTDNIASSLTISPTTMLHIIITIDAIMYL